MDIRFDGKKALVTGAGKGIGRGVAIKLAELGANVVAVSRTQSDLDELRKLNTNIKTICLNVGDWEATKLTLQSEDDIDLLVNNAAIVGNHTTENISEKDVDEVYNVNLKSAINISVMVAKNMKRRGESGSIINVSSISGLQGEPHNLIYGTSKAAMDQLTRTMAVQYGPYNIRVNSVNPTTIRTRMAEAYFNPSNEHARYFMELTPLRRFGELEEIVDPIIFLLSSRASLITGVSLAVDGGATITSLKDQNDTTAE